MTAGTVVDRPKPATAGMDNADMDKRRRLERLDRVARMLDSQWRIPGLGVRFGADAVASIIPGVGDAATGLVSAWLIYECHRLGAPAHVTGRMIGNVVLDTLVGSVPVAGTVFDVFFRANNRNMRILRSHLQKELGG